MRGCKRAVLLSADAGVAVALQRPDFYLFGTAPAATGAGFLVGALRAALRGAP